MVGHTPVLVHNATVPCAQVGLADAASNISGTSGKMNGVLYADMDDAPYYVSSGFKNLDPGYGAPPGVKPRFEHHLEARAAARMRATGQGGSPVHYGRLHLWGVQIFPGTDAAARLYAHGDICGQ